MGYKTKYSVHGLIDMMIEKYGLALAIVLLKQQYNYKIKATKTSVIFKCTDNLGISSGVKYTVVMALSDQEKAGLNEILNKG